MSERRISDCVTPGLGSVARNFRASLSQWLPAVLFADLPEMSAGISLILISWFYLVGPANLHKFIQYNLIKRLHNASLWQEDLLKRGNLSIFNCFYGILSVIVLFLFLSVVRLSVTEAFTLEKFGQLTVCEHEVALETIDSCQEASDYPLYKLEILRAQACINLAQFTQSLKILKKVQNMVSLKNDHQACRYVLAKLSKVAMLSYD